MRVPAYLQRVSGMPGGNQPLIPATSVGRSVQDDRPRANTELPRARPAPAADKSTESAPAAQPIASPPAQPPVDYERDAAVVSKMGRAQTAHPHPSVERAATEPTTTARRASRREKGKAPAGDAVSEREAIAPHAEQGIAAERSPERRAAEPLGSRDDTNTPRPRRDRAARVERAAHDRAPENEAEDVSSPRQSPPAARDVIKVTATREANAPPLESGSEPPAAPAEDRIRIGTLDVHVLPPPDRPAPVGPPAALARGFRSTVGLRQG